MGVLWRALGASEKMVPFSATWQTPAVCTQACQSSQSTKSNQCLSVQSVQSVPIKLIILISPINPNQACQSNQSTKSNQYLSVQSVPTLTNRHILSSKLMKVQFLLLYPVCQIGVFVAQDRKHCRGVELCSGKEVCAVEAKTNISVMKFGDWGRGL